MKIQNISVLVTGGASGLGRAVAATLLQAGARVTVLDLPNEKNMQSVKEMNGDVQFVPCDVTNSEQIENAITQAKEKFGPIKAAINCAGIAFAIKTLSKSGVATLDPFNKTLAVNLVGTFNVCRLAAAAMAENQPNEDGERGVLVNTASVAAYDGQMGQVAYSASKGGIVGMTLPLARDLAQSGIRVMTIAPGIFDTPMLALLPEAARESLGKQVPFPSRLGRPSEFASLVQQIIENPMLNGEVIRLDGALRMGMR